VVEEGGVKGRERKKGEILVFFLISFNSFFFDSGRATSQPNLLGLVSY